MATTKETEFLIIGSGAIGATYARCLAGTGHQVTMIDTGPQLRPRPGAHLLNSFRYQHQPNLSLDEMMANHEVFSVTQQYDPASLPAGIYRPSLERLNFQNPEQLKNLNMAMAGTMYAVGGMFSLWSGFAPIPTLEERTPLISPEIWRSTLRSAVKLLNTHTDVFDSPVQEAIKQTLPGVTNTPMGAHKRVLAGPNPRTFYVDWTGSDTILGDLLKPDNTPVANLEILEVHRAEELIHSGSKVTAVRVRNMDTMEMIDCHADQVIVAGGTFLSARLLWKSNIRPDALGRYIEDNPVVAGEIGFGWDFIDILRNDDGNPARGDVVPILWDQPPPKCQLPPRAKEGKPWLIHFSRNGRNTVYDFPYDIRLSTDVTGYSVVETNPDNRVTFSDKYLDRFGMPQMTIDYRMSAKDIQMQDDLLGEITELGGKLGGFYERPHKMPQGTSLHLTGVTRMGKDPNDSVVDTNCKVWGFDNLHIGGQGVMPKGIASNPTLTSCAIAIHSAAALLKLTPDELAEKVCPDADYTDPGMPLDAV